MKERFLGPTYLLRQMTLTQIQNPPLCLPRIKEYNPMSAKTPLFPLTMMDNNGEEAKLASRVARLKPHLVIKG